jgi:hypothetical protein
VSESEVPEWAFESARSLRRPDALESEATGVGSKTASFRGREFFVRVSALAFPLRQSRAIGVGQRLSETASISVPPFLAFLGVTLPPLVPRDAVGVGQRPDRAIVSRLGRGLPTRSAEPPRFEP